MQPVIRALAVLRLLAPNPNGLTLADLSHRLDVPVGSMHRIVAVLEGEQFVTRSPSNRRYFLGPAARQLAEENDDRHALLVTPHPALSDAAEATGETVFLTELVGDQAICVSLVESVHPLRMFVRIGQNMPLHASASARALLAHLGEDQARRLLSARPLTAYTAETLTEIDAVIEHLTMVRAQGYDVCDDELDRGVWAVSLPVRTSTGRVAASVTLAAPAYRVADAADRDHMRDAVAAAATTMSADLGWNQDGDAVVGTAANTKPTSSRKPDSARTS